MLCHTGDRLSRHSSRHCSLNGLKRLSREERKLSLQIENGLKPDRIRYPFNSEMDTFVASMHVEFELASCIRSIERINEAAQGPGTSADRYEIPLFQGVHNLNSNLLDRTRVPSKHSSLKCSVVNGDLLDEMTGEASSLGPEIKHLLFL